MTIRRLIEKYGLNKKFIAESTGFKPSTFFNKINPDNNITSLTEKEQEVVLDFLIKIGDNVSKKARIMKKRNKDEQ